MEGSSKLISALGAALKAFGTTADKLIRVREQIATDRAKAINYAVDVAKSEGLKPAQIVKVIDAEVFMPAFEGGLISGPTRYQYRSGLGKALGHGVAWSPKSFELPAIQEQGKTRKGRPPKASTKAVTIGTVKVDRKARKVELTLGKATDLDAFTNAVAAIQSEPGRVTLFLNYCKAQGWTK